MHTKEITALARKLAKEGKRGWLSPDGEFFESDPTPHVRIAGLELGGHERAALRWLQQHRLDLLDQLEQERIAGGFMDWVETDGLDVIKKFMFKHGFVRVAAD